MSRHSAKTRGRAVCRDVLTLMTLDALEIADTPTLARLLRLAARDGKLRETVRAALDGMDAEDAPAVPPGVCAVWAEGWDEGGPVGRCDTGFVAADLTGAMRHKAQLEFRHEGEPGRVYLTDMHGIELDCSRAWGEAVAGREGGV